MGIITDTIHNRYNILLKNIFFTENIKNVYCTPEFKIQSNRQLISNINSVPTYLCSLIEIVVSSAGPQTTIQLK